jgi:predicted amidohydrolase
MSQVARNRLIRGTSFLLFALCLLGQASARGKSENLTVSAVQTSIDFSLYESEGHFMETVQSLANEASAGGRADLIVFPEYLDVFLSFIPYYQLFSDVDTIQEGFQAIAKAYPGVENIGDIIEREDGRVEALMDSFWGEIARKTDAVVVAGTYLDYDAESGGLYNTAVVYGEDGRRLYSQKKVFLTSFEVDLLGLSPGSLSAVELFGVDGKQVGLTICRDTFFEVFYPMLRDAQLWIDIKANGEVFDKEQRALFSRALPSRLIDVPVRYGLTVCLTGRYLDLFWQGESSFIGKIGPGIGVLRTSRTATEEEVLTLTLPYER